MQRVERAGLETIASARLIVPESAILPKVPGSRLRRDWIGAAGLPSIRSSRSKLNRSLGSARMRPAAALDVVSGANNDARAGAQGFLSCGGQRKVTRDLREECRDARWVIQGPHRRLGIIEFADRAGLLRSIFTGSKLVIRVVLLLCCLRTGSPLLTFCRKKGLDYDSYD